MMDNLRDTQCGDAPRLHDISVNLRRATLFALALLVISNRGAADDQLPAAAIEARDVFLRIKDTADVPALERGQLKHIAAEPGDTVEPGQLLAELDDVESKLNQELARIVCLKCC